MSANNLIIDVAALQTVETGIQGNMEASKENLEKVLQELQAARAEWSDEDMDDLLESVGNLQAQLDVITDSGKTLLLRCQRKRQALERLHSMTI